MYKKYPWWKYYLTHPIEFIVCVFGVCVALAWNWVEWHEDEINHVIKKIKKFFRRK